MEPYIGITGYMTRDEVLGTFEQHPAFGGRLLMVGVLASSKTLAGQPNKYPNRYPKVTEIADIFVNHQFALNVVHYATDNANQLADQLDRLVELGGQHLHGFQINVKWPPPVQLLYLKQRHEELVTILQVGYKALQEVAFSPSQLVAKLNDYSGVADYVLLDPSGGTGTKIDLELATALVEKLESLKDHPMVGIAGGLSAESLEEYAPLLRMHPQLSIDAEGRLRDERDHLDLTKADAYLAKALEVLPELM